MGIKLFKDRLLTIATMHGKEQVIQPLVEKNLQVKCLLPLKINTDIFGTFSGEIDRKTTPVETLRLKCESGFHLTGTDLAIASEGSFGQHPHLFFAKANEELIMLKDKLNGLEIIANHLTTETNFDGQEVSSPEQAYEFAASVFFPTHGLILKKHKNAKTCIEKGISNPDRLHRLVNKHLRHDGKLWIETDMRAMYNPTRMRSIQQAVCNLIQKLESCCPSCRYPGFWISRVKAGLPCSLCGSPTRSTYSHIYQCWHCMHEKEKKFPYSKQYEDPMYCDFCNP